MPHVSDAAHFFCIYLARLQGIGSDVGFTGFCKLKGLLHCSKLSARLSHMIGIAWVSVFQIDDPAHLETVF